MTPITEIGEALICDARENGRDYLLSPTFAAMMRLGEPEEIVELYATIHRADLFELIKRCKAVSDGVLSWALSQPSREQEKLMCAAMRIMQACCETDMTPIIGEWVGDDAGIRYIPGIMKPDAMIVAAQSLIQHGISGKAKVRKLQRHETNETATGFNAIEYINAAIIHFGISRAEAMQLTMTAFHMLLAAKYPDQKGFTREEYDAVADDFLARQAARRAAAAQQNH